MHQIFILFFKTYMLLYWVYALYPHGGVGVPCTPLSNVMDPLCDLSSHVFTTSCLLVLSYRFLCRFRPSDLMYLRFWGGVEALLGLGISQRAYLNRLSPVLPCHCRRWTLILCAGTLDPQMHRCVARTKVMAILLLNYTNALK